MSFMIEYKLRLKGKRVFYYFRNAYSLGREKAKLSRVYDRPS